MSIEDVAKRSPVDKTAAVVAGKGVEYVSPKVVLTADSDVPLPTRNVPKDVQNLTGIRRCRLVVVGLSLNVCGRWVCRCDCGAYTLRTARAIKNEGNPDRCEHCRHLAYLKRTDEFRRVGRNRSDKWD